MHTSRYVSKQPDAAGQVHYSPDENQVWAELYARQVQAINHRACDEFMQGLELLALPHDRVPQLPDVSAVLRKTTGWEVAPVPALIPFQQFFELLSQKKFPAATFIRRRDEMNYLQEPDIFHELFGHAPLLTNPYFAEFTHRYGKLGLAADEIQREFLARLFWFTVEFGLIKPRDGELRIYGGGILSSIGETQYAVGPKPQRARFDALEALRTPYRIDIMQPKYFVIEDLRELYELARADIMQLVTRAQNLGLHPPLYSEHTQTAPRALAA